MKNIDFIYTVNKNKVGYEFTAMAETAKVGDQVLVFSQYANTPYGIAEVKAETNNGFKMKVVWLFL